jgi:hypothetical protein
VHVFRRSGRTAAESCLPVGCAGALVSLATTITCLDAALAGVEDRGRAKPAKGEHLGVGRLRRSDLASSGDDNTGNKNARDPLHPHDDPRPP